MMRWFADTYFWLAYLNPKDSGHKRASEWMENHEIGQIVTTEWILLEVADAMSHPRNRSSVVEFIRDLRFEPEVSILEYDNALFVLGFELFASRPDKEWSLTDCISFVVMQDQTISKALTADHHFEQAGFVAILK